MKLVILLIAATACSKSKRPETATTSDPSGVAACEEPQEPMCPRSSCGANAPTVNSFPTNGLRPDGECNYDGVQLLPGTVNGGKCTGSTLTLRDGELVTIAPSDGSLVCRSKDLQGASFQLRSWTKTNGKYNTLTVHIAAVIPAYHADTQHPRTAYRLTDDSGRSLCTAKASSEARSKLGLKEITALTDPTPGRDAVIPVRAELYNASGHAIRVSEKWKIREPEWLHLACVDDALAKRSLYNLHTDNVAISRSALMMLMANYCGDLHATGRGREISWEIADAAAAPRSASILEAKWGPDGAVCLSNPRELYQQGLDPHLPKDPQGDLLAVQTQCPDCTSPDAWANAVRGCQTFKAKHRPPAPRPTCEQCGDACKGVLLHSYVIPKTAAP